MKTKIASLSALRNQPGQYNHLIAAPNARAFAYDAHVARVDHQLNEKQHFFSQFVRGRYRPRQASDV